MADKAYFISDLHLGSTTEPNAFILLRFLRAFTSREQISHLILVGDIFDLWIANHVYFKIKFDAILVELIRLKNLGVEIHYFEGNHDLYLEDYFAHVLGCQVHRSAQTFQLAGRKVRVEHGDEMDLDDRGYRFLRWLLRTPVLEFVARRLPSAFVVKLGETMSHASRRYTSEMKVISQDRARKVIREHAAKMHGDSNANVKLTSAVAAKGKFDMLIAGHVHLVEDHQSNGYRVVNLGSWFDGTRAFVVTHESAEFIQLK